MQPAKRSNTRKRIKRQKANEKMVGALSDEQIAAYEEAFRMFDKNGDGQIEFSEMKLVFEMMGDKDMSDAQIRQGISAVDVDGDLTIDLEEFIGMMEAKMGTSGKQEADVASDPDTELRAVFDVFDKDGDGSITAEEIHNVLMKFGQHLSLEELQLMIAEADEDGDMTVDFEEFKQLMHF